MPTFTMSRTSVLGSLAGAAALSLSALAGAALVHTASHAWIGWVLITAAGGACGLVISRLLGALRRAEALKAEQLSKIDRMLSICCYCKRVEVDTRRPLPNEWVPVEVYFNVNAGTEFSHGMCPECEQELYRREFGVERPEPSSSEPPPPRNRQPIALPAATTGQWCSHIEY